MRCHIESAPLFLITYSKLRHLHRKKKNRQHGIQCGIVCIKVPGIYILYASLFSVLHSMRGALVSEPIQCKVYIISSFQTPAVFVKILSHSFRGARPPGNLLWLWGFNMCKHDRFHSAWNARLVNHASCFCFQSPYPFC